MLLASTLCITIAVYWPGLSGGWLFDDYPNIVDNPGVQPHEVSIASLTSAALSSPASDFKRPLASLSFALNYLAGGLNPFWMKLSNLIIHLLNGLLVFLLTRQLLNQVQPQSGKEHNGLVAVLIALGWMLLPINLTSVLYTVQRMESMATLFVLLGLVGYVEGRRRMLSLSGIPPLAQSASLDGFVVALCSIVTMTVVGLLAKETAVMLPLYAFLIEWIVFGFKRAGYTGDTRVLRDRRVVWLFFFLLLLPAIVGLAVIAPGLSEPSTWATRDFNLHTRLLSEARVVVDYIIWTVLPSPHALSFYHDDFKISTSLLSPWTTLACIICLIALVAIVFRLRTRRPLIALGIALFLGCHLLTATILPLELVYEHRNYFASLGILIALMPFLAFPGVNDISARTRLLCRVLIGTLMLLWAAETSLTAIAWGDPLKLAETLAVRGPDSPRAQYELGRTLIIYSEYDPLSPFTKMAYAPLERAASLPGSSILPEQALIFMNARMHRPLEEAWWKSMIAKLKAHKPGVQDESSLGALTQCARDNECNLPKDAMINAFSAALSHPDPSARLLDTYGDYAWNVLNDHALGQRMIEAAVQAQPYEPAYHISLARMQIALGHTAEAEEQLKQLEALNIGGRLNRDIFELRRLLRKTS
ncbi:tetratricopeptide repeat protein [Dyella humi]|uniref:tetratricopeptide repeat protein n=1 Tax=Dyella humi TaxID=1770547 RepID=UPI00360CD7C8